MKEQTIAIILVLLFLFVGTIYNLTNLTRIPYCDDGKREVNYYSDRYTDTYTMKYDCLHKSVLKGIHKNLGEDIRPYNDIQCKFKVISNRYIYENPWFIYCFNYNGA